MSGIYDYTRRPDEPPRANPVGALGDISSALFATIGILAALRYRDGTGEGQHVDVAMLDATVAMTDIVTNFASLGLPQQPYPPAYILDTFKTKAGCSGSASTPTTCSAPSSVSTTPNSRPWPRLASSPDGSDPFRRHRCSQRRCVGRVRGMGSSSEGHPGHGRRLRRPHG